LLQDLIGSWRSDAKIHHWTLPDGFECKIRTMVKQTERIEIDEIKSSFTYTYYETGTERKAARNAANVIHSVDAYILRSLIRRCSYDPSVLDRAFKLIESELLVRFMYGQNQPEPTSKIKDYIDLYESTGIADIVILDYLDDITVTCLDTDHLKSLMHVLSSMDHRPFDVVSIHDNFLCHPNNMNHLRKHYNNILADIADSTIMDRIFSDIYKTDVRYQKIGAFLSSRIKNANYAIT
jgi:hypothetical protein